MKSTEDTENCIHPIRRHSSIISSATKHEIEKGFETIRRNDRSAMHDAALLFRNEQEESVLLATSGRGAEPSRSQQPHQCTAGSFPLDACIFRTIFIIFSRIELQISRASTHRPVLAPNGVPYLMNSESALVMECLIGTEENQHPRTTLSYLNKRETNGSKRLHPFRLKHSKRFSSVQRSDRVALFGPQR
jgi:hypothetical protein